MASWAGCTRGWRERLLTALALIEAEIDFAPDEEVPDAMLARVLPDLRRICGRRWRCIWPTTVGASACGRA